MNQKKFLQTRLVIYLFVLLIVTFSVIKDSYLLSLIGVVTGFIFSVLARSRYKPVTDERQIFLHQKAAQTTYSIFIPTIALASAILLFPSLSRLSVFSHGEFAFIDAVGIIFAYLSLFSIVIYAVSYHFFNKKY